ncbi:hypothetical protein C9J47_04705 [Photobacterium indicum]|uniref:Uncharacterized protein n=1 Tax=Photobacterium indicum TaxID=81447 RepID=A0A2T3LEQ9_9GAMM|nr:hypothetical protein C9J47_04705 [Photobacterium indicum]
MCPIEPAKRTEFQTKNAECNGITLIALLRAGAEVNAACPPHRCNRKTLNSAEPDATQAIRYRQPQISIGIIKTAT